MWLKLRFEFFFFFFFFVHIYLFLFLQQPQDDYGKGRPKFSLKDGSKVKPHPSSVTADLDRIKTNWLLYHQVVKVYFDQILIERGF